MEKTFLVVVYVIGITAAICLVSLFPGAFIMAAWKHTGAYQAEYRNHGWIMVEFFSTTVVATGYLLWLAYSYLKGYLAHPGKIVSYDSLKE